MSWTNNAWMQITPLYQRIIQMPFIVEMMNGELAVEKFQFYITQDAHYLEHFGRSLSIIAGRIQNIHDSLAFMRFAEGAVLVENALHESYFNDFNVTGKGDMQPTCHHYAHFLKSTAALESVEVAVAAVLPCFWIYKEVGDYIYKNQKCDTNPYKKWIETYAGDDFKMIAQQAIDICDRQASHSSITRQQCMTEAFITSSRLEFQFWDSAYNLKSW